MSAPAGKAVLARNTASSFLGYFVAFAVPILLTPYIFHKVGRDGFGILAALGTLGLWLSRFDLGIWAALPREVADRRARDDRAGLESLATTWLTVDILFGAVLMGGVVAVGRAWLPWLLPAEKASEIHPVLIAIGLQAVLAPLLRHLIGSLEGMQRLDWVSKTNAVVSPLSAIGVVLFLERGWGLLGVAVNGVIFSVLQIVAFAVMLRRAGYPLTFEPSAYRAADLKRLIGFGWKLEANQLLLQAFRSDRLLLAITGLPAALIGFYQIGAGAADRLVSLVQTLSSAVLPAASDLAARSDRDRIVLLLMRGTKYGALAATGLVGFAALFAPEVLVLWLGQPMAEASAVLRLLAAGLTLSAIVTCAKGVAVALGGPGRVLGGTLSGLAGAAILYIAVGRRYDYGGLAGSISAGMALAQAVFMIGFHGLLEFRWREWVGNAFLKPLAAIVPLLAVHGVWRWASPHLLPEVTGRLQALAVLAPAFALSVGLAWALARTFKVIDDYDVDVLKSLGRRSAA